MSEVNALSSKTEMKPFDHLENPLVFTMPVRKELFLFGNTSDEYPIHETVGGIYVVYDTTTESVYDWAFCEGRNFTYGNNYCAPVANGLFYAEVFQDGTLDETGRWFNRLVRLDTTTGKIAAYKISSFPFFDYDASINKYYISLKDDAHYGPDGNTFINSDYTITLRDTTSLEDKSFSFTVDAQYISYNYNDTMYIICTMGENTYLKRLSDDGNSLINLLDLGKNEAGMQYNILDISENYVFINKYLYSSENDTNNWDFQKKLIYNISQPEKPPVEITNENTNNKVKKYEYGTNFVYKNKYYLLQTGYTSDYKIILYQSDIENIIFEKIVEIDETLYQFKKIGSKIYFWYENSNDIPIYYLDLDTLEFKKSGVISKSQMLEDLK